LRQWGANSAQQGKLPVGIVAEKILPQATLETRRADTKKMGRYDVPRGGRIMKHTAKGASGNRRDTTGRGRESGLKKKSLISTSQALFVTDQQLL